MTENGLPVVVVKVPVQVAVAPLNATPLQLKAAGRPPKLTVPPVGVGLTVAVKVSGVPTVTGLAEDMIVVVVDVPLTVSASVFEVEVR